MASTHEVGRRFEGVAARHLTELGWQILAKNVRFERKEIDLVARRGQIVAFVEVKGRRGAGFGHALEAIDWRKRREVATVAQWWIDRFGTPELMYRFDAVAIDRSPDGRFVVRHIEDAWRLD